MLAPNAQGVSVSVGLGACDADSTSGVGFVAVDGRGNVGASCASEVVVAAADGGGDDTVVRVSLAAVVGPLGATRLSLGLQGCPIFWVMHASDASDASAASAIWYR